MTKVLDKGFVEVMDSLGTDLTVANAARVSFGKRKTKWDKTDARLVRYLAKYKHFSPFRHLQVQFHIKAPEFVNKQASDGVLDDLQQKRMNDTYDQYMRQVDMTYYRMIEAGMAKEQARIVLPLSQYTEVYWTASFQAIMNFIELRDEVTAQWEIQQYAKVIKESTLEIYPETTKIWGSQV